MTTYSYAIEERANAQAPWRVAANPPMEFEESNLAIGPFGTWKAIQLEREGIQFGDNRRIAVQQWPD